MSLLNRHADRSDALRTDLYQLTMAAAYFQNGMTHRASFEMFNRKLLPGRGYHLAAGLELALDYLENLSFSERDIDALRRHPHFGHVKPDFYDYLRDFRFTGTVWAMPEGTPYFPNEPVLRVEAPVIEAQIVETFLLSVVNFQTLIATKAARIVEAAGGRPVVDFGTRRAHGPEAGELAARAAFIGGCTGTSNVAAGTALGIPVLGTFAHSWVMAFEDEEEAFRAYQSVFPDSTTQLVDTYDTIEGVEKVCRLGRPVRSIRLDSGDLVELSKAARHLLDGAGLQETKIVASNDLNEYKIAELLERGAPIDIFGVGTELVTSKDCPALGGVYKLVEQEDRGGDIVYRMKQSKDKMSLPGAKQVWRVADTTGISEDVIGLADEAGPRGGEPLLRRVMADGLRLRPGESLKEIQARALSSVRRLSPDCRRLSDPTPVPTRLTSALVELTTRIRREHDERRLSGRV